tara:strand:- start:347 stop:1186 length:840 start_codon:yes stop_codon:yes gene_type:complete
MRLLVPVSLVMTAFAANSLLNRAAVAGGQISPMGFALIRVLAGAVTLAVLTRAPARPWPARANLVPALALSAYLIGFSLAYLALDAGVGALILFAGVQVTMLTGALVSGEPLPPRRLIGAGVALLGLAVLLLPGAQAAPGPVPVLLMGGAALGWGVYSLAGRRVRNPLAQSAANFILAVPMVALAALPFGWASMTWQGAGLAVLSGAVMSGLGYALWYAVLPALGAGRAAVAQLSVPVIAILGGVVFLGESLSGLALLASAIVLAGVALASFPARTPRE